MKIISFTKISLFFASLSRKKSASILKCRHFSVSLEISFLHFTRVFQCFQNLKSYKLKTKKNLGKTSKIYSKRIFFQNKFYNLVITSKIMKEPAIFNIF